MGLYLDCGGGSFLPHFSCSFYKEQTGPSKEIVYMVIRSVVSVLWQKLAVSKASPFLMLCVLSFY